jgi:hypothetical protein
MGKMIVAPVPLGNAIPGARVWSGLVLILILILFLIPFLIVILLLILILSRLSQTPSTDQMPLMKY